MDHLTVLMEEVSRGTLSERLFLRQRRLVLLSRQGTAFLLHLLPTSSTPTISSTDEQYYLWYFWIVWLSLSISFDRREVRRARRKKTLP